MVAVAAFMVAGILIDRHLHVTLEVWSLVAVVGLIAWWWRWRQRRLGGSLVLLLLAVAASAGMWHQLRWRYFSVDDIGLWARTASAPVCVEAVALSAPERIAAPDYNPMRVVPAWEQSRVALRLQRLRDGEAWRPAGGTAMLTVDGHLLGVRAGDRLRIFAQFAAPKPEMNPGGFDASVFQRRQRHLCRLFASYPDCAKVIAQGAAFTPRRMLGALRSSARSVLWRSVSEPHADLAVALMLGMRRQVDRRLVDAFATTGTLHLLSISGLHVGLLASAIFFALRLGWLPERAALLGASATAVFYALMTGGHPPIVRATVVVLAVCAARLLGRRVVSLNILAVAGIVVLVLNPTAIFATGAQLSFLAVMALGWFTQRPARWQDPLDRLIAGSRPLPIRVTRKVGHWSARLLLASLAIWLVTLPLVMARFHLVTPVAPLLNVALAIPVTLALTCGFATMTIGWLVPPLAAPFGLLTEMGLSVLERIISAAARLHGGHFWVPGPADWWLVGLYSSAGLWLLLPRWRPPRRWCVGGLAAWIGIGLWASTTHRSNDELTCTFLSVGHGCAVVLELPDGRTLLYDAGRLGSPEAGAQEIAAFLWQRGLTHLDAVVLSHADADHYNALPELLRRFSVGVVYTSPMMFERPAAALALLRAAIRDSATPLRELYAPNRLKTSAGQVRIEVLHPTRQGVLGSDNANSLVLVIEVHGRRILLTGDLEPPGTDALLAETPMDCDVLLAPHHGSMRSDPDAVAEWSTPEWVVISGANHDDAGDVTNVFQNRGACVLHTGKVGAVRVTIRQRAFEVSSMHSTGID